MDSYQPIYDAVRSKLSNGDIGAAVETVMRDNNFTHYAEQTSAAYQQAAAEQMRPCVLFKPKISIDGNQWCALYGDNVQDGICGFGKSPADAMHDFDREFHTNIKSNI